MKNPLKPIGEPQLTTGEEKPAEKERMYKFVRKTGPRPEDLEEIQVPESELTHSQTNLLLNEMWQAYTYMPDIVQDLFTARLMEDKIKLRRSADQAAIKPMIITGEA